MYDIGPALTCSEANTLGQLFSALGLTDLAVELLEAHRNSDEDGDEHFDGSVNPSSSLAPT